MMSKINITKTSEIEAIRVARQNDLYQINKTDSPTVENKATVSQDKLEFSERATEVGKLIEQVKQFPDVRQAKVNELRTQITAGEYHPTSEEIADAILKDEIAG